MGAGMNRRELLYRAGGSAIGSAAGVAGVMVVAKAISCTAEAACPGITVDPPVSPQDRLGAAVTELKAALVAVDPTIKGWINILPIGDEPGYRFGLIAVSGDSDRPDGDQSGEKAPPRLEKLKKSIA